jgi:hypothetical protein
MTLTRKKKPISTPKKKSATPNSTSSPYPMADRPKDQLSLALTFPDPEGPRLGSAFLELARDCELPLGSRGALLLSQLRELELGIDLFRRRYHHQLGEVPDSVPGWGLQHSSVREIPDALVAFRLVESNPALRDAFFDACKVRITELEKGFAAVQALSQQEAPSFVNRFFRELIQFREITRSVELKGFKAWQQTRRLTEGRAE